MKIATASAWGCLAHELVRALASLNHVYVVTQDAPGRTTGAAVLARRAAVRRSVACPGARTGSR
jgi:hypothetical protein